MEKKAIIIGAGPAGLTAAYELLKRTDIIPIVLEKSGEIGGISRTIDYKGNRMDMGPHRFFSKSDRVMEWWLNIMPLEQSAEKDPTISYQNKQREVHATTQGEAGSDKVILVIKRLTRIYFLRKFFSYPIQLSLDTLRNLGVIRAIKILLSFAWAKLFPRSPEKSLEDFLINKFGWQLYRLFFKDYTEKVWGVPCNEISAEWGAQRIKGVSLGKAISQAAKSLRKRPKNDLSQKGTETSLIEQFLYPKKGPGALWEEVARQVQAMGGRIYLHQNVQKIHQEGGKITGVATINSETGQTGAWEGDYYFSTMPVQELIAGMDGEVPEKVKEVAQGLQYRDFINVGLLLRQMNQPLKDNWIYIQERDVKVGRLMIYNNWGDGMVKDPGTAWIGMEYFCNKTDALWEQTDEFIQNLAIMELEKLGLAKVEDVLDATVRKREKTYPAYFGTYHEFDHIKNYTDRFENLFLIGRNGMHKYNNADHSMLCAMVAVDNVCAGVTAKANLWAINTEQDYHEVKQEQPAKRPAKAPELQVQPSFLDYIWKDKRNRAYLLFALAAFVLQFIIFKFKYPFANYMPDSYSYLEAAYTNADVNMWPVAYSKFLRMISVFTHEDKIVVGLQYFFMQASTLLFFYSLCYFLKPGKVYRNIMYIFFVFSPLPSYIANYISADAMFIGLSLCWVSSLLWIIYQPRPWQIPIQAILLLACFTVRYNAIYYPVIAGLAFILSRQRWLLKLAGIGLGCILVACSILYTAAKMEKMTGQRQFSAFGGWQLANNALYMYEQIRPEDRKPVPARYAKLEAMVRQHMDTLKKVKLTSDDSASTFFYLWSSHGPLIKYMQKEWKNDSTSGYFKRWASEGPLYASYASYLISQYPAKFVKAFVLPNAFKFVVPPSEFIGVYNMGSDSVGKLAKDWFNYKSLKILEHGKKHTIIKAVIWAPVFAAMVNSLVVICFIGLIIFGISSKKNWAYSMFDIMIGALWICNLSFSILASPIVLRYQIFHVLVGTVFSLLAIDRIIRIDNNQVDLAPTTRIQQLKKIIK